MRFILTICFLLCSFARPFFVGSIFFVFELIFVNYISTVSFRPSYKLLWIIILRPNCDCVLFDSLDFLDYIWSILGIKSFSCYWKLQHFFLNQINSSNQFFSQITLLILRKIMEGLWGFFFFSLCFYYEGYSSLCQFFIF